MNNERKEHDSDFEELVVEWIKEKLRIRDESYSFNDVCNLDELVTLLAILLPNFQLFRCLDTGTEMKLDFVTNRKVVNHAMRLLGISQQYYVPDLGYTVDTIPSFKTMLMVLIHKLIQVIGDEPLDLPILLREMVLNTVAIMSKENTPLLPDLLMEYKPKFWHSYLQDEIEVKKMQSNFSDMEDLEYPEVTEQTTEQTSDDYKNRIESLIYQWLNRMGSENDENNSSIDFVSRQSLDDSDRSSDEFSNLSDSDSLENSKEETGQENSDNYNLDWFSLYKNDLFSFDSHGEDEMEDELEGTVANERNRQKVDGIKAFLQMLGDKKQYFKDDQN